MAVGGLRHLDTHKRPSDRLLCAKACPVWKAADPWQRFVELSQHLARKRAAKKAAESSGGPGTDGQATMLNDGSGGPIDHSHLSPWEAHKLAVERRSEAFAKQRGSVVLKVVHHEFDEYVDGDTAIEAIDIIRTAPEDAKIDVILHTPGGIASATQQILHALKNHKGPKTAFVPYRAKSAGTMIALACDEIVMGSSAVLGPIDPQYAWMPAPILAELTQQKSADRISDEMMILSKMAQQAVSEARRFCFHVRRARSSVTLPAPSAGAGPG